MLQGPNSRDVAARRARSLQLTARDSDWFGLSLRSGHARAAGAHVHAQPPCLLTWEDIPFLRERTKPPCGSRASCTRTTRAARSTRASTASSSPNTVAARSTARASTIEALPGIAAAVDGRIPIVLDSRRALRRRRVQGARARRDCGRPRPALRLRARDRRRGRRARGAANLQADFDLTLGLSGCRSVSEIGPENLTSAAGARHCLSRSIPVQRNPVHGPRTSCGGVYRASRRTTRLSAAIGRGRLRRAEHDGRRRPRRPAAVHDQPAHDVRGHRRRRSTVMEQLGGDGLGG